MYDYLTTKTADYTDEILTLTPQKTLMVVADKSQIIHEYDGGNVDVVSFSDSSILTCTLQWLSILKADADSIFDLYNDPVKANGRERTFYWKHLDNEIYVARFTGPITQTYTPNLHAGGRRAIEQITLRIEGRKAD